MYVNYEGFLNLVKGTDKFWSLNILTDVKLSKLCQWILHKTKVMVHTYITIYIATLFTFNLRVYFLKSENMFILPTYAPENALAYLILMCQEIVLLWCIPPSVVCFDVFFLTVIILSQIQFKLLNNQIEDMLLNRPERKNFQEQLKKWVDHHNYMLR